MWRTIAIALVTLFSPTHAMQSAPKPHGTVQQNAHTLVGGLVARMYQRCYEMRPIHHADLDNTTFDKSSSHRAFSSAPPGILKDKHALACVRGISHRSGRINLFKALQLTFGPLDRSGARTHHMRQFAGRGGAGSLEGGGGDLSGGGDSERNANLEKLRKMFMAPAAQDVPEAEAMSTPSNATDDVRRLGLLLDLPLCRFSWCILPHHQVTLNIWQPQYTLMFSKLLAEPGPHYYLHVLLPGGAESLGQPGYELVPGSQASLVGTLMRVVYAKQQPDGRLALVVQGLARGVVLRSTQDLPYSRGDVQILPESEALLAGACAVERYLEGQLRAGSADSASNPNSSVSVPDLVKRRMVTAAVVAETESFFPYEATQLSMDAGGNIAPLNQFNESSIESVSSVADTMENAFRETMIPVSEELNKLYNGSLVMETLQVAVTAAKNFATSGALHSDEEALETLGMLEVQVWLELDDLLKILTEAAKEVRGSIPIPSQVLGLLPPAPQPAGWPENFELNIIVEQLDIRHRNLTATANASPPAAGTTRAISYVPVDPRYPLRKRAERLSWVIWAIIGTQKIGVNAFGGSPYQEVLEAEGTADRLRLALRKMRELKQQIQS
eukprot:gnl/TRDRNA2_/TRDRNA2_28383_c0_seq1.p1 gnl/TRDRNA2_/TRDRNA2_28383_c0~~gnl/TRDRNA2_/TRDRNA2_28383_c0_seq1.p1  ORF type:complete len:613 (+),score=101.51 gnl/TRDRNA2_/TRDRNA2_28383_c0_seq1:158-1996(+)